MNTEKAPLSEANLPDHTTQPLIRAWFEILHLKQLFRKGWLQRGIPETRCESVAEHCFGNAFLCLLLLDTHPELDREKVLRLALVHDLGEVYAGDLTPRDKVTKADKFKREKAAIDKIIGAIPACQSLLNDWHEYEEQNSPEAQFVKKIDRLEFALQASHYQHQGLLDAEDLMEKLGHELSGTTLLNSFSRLFPIAKASP